MRALLTMEDGAQSFGVNDLVIDIGRNIVEVDGKRVWLTKKECQVLALLSSRKGTMVTTEFILNHLYGRTDARNPKIIAVFICNLRKKLVHAIKGKVYIETVRGRGYVLRNAYDGEGETSV